MKKKILVIYLFMFYSFFIVPQNFNFSPLYPLQTDKPQEQNIFILYDDILFSSYYSSDGIISYYSGQPANFITHIVEDMDSGYFFITYKEFLGKEYERSAYLLQGKGVIILSDRNGRISKTKLNTREKEYEKKFLFRKNNPDYKGSEGEGWGRIISVDNNIKTIKASSSLKEYDTVYTPTGVISKIFFETGDDYINYFYDSITPPWIEGVDGYGIGEYLDIEFKYETDELQVLNGFVDFRRQYLFKENSRIKTVLIESQNPRFSKEYELEDCVKYTVIKLPYKTNSIQMIIKDVYPGDKYDDTCLSSIIIKDPSIPSFEEQQSLLLKQLKDISIWEKIKELKGDKTVNYIR